MYGITVFQHSLNILSLYEFPQKATLWIFANLHKFIIKFSETLSLETGLKVRLIKKI
ncbi:hypothetical protein LEP1GSC198_0403 [Leptospira kirschneri str. JB]|nr:hypothetical protein LEP1GSC198_0403 [Leptospira kirschneri str. JB]